MWIHVHVDTCACGYMCMCASNGDKVGIIRNVAMNRMMVGVASRILESVKFTDKGSQFNSQLFLILIRCILSLSQAFLNNAEFKISGRHWESNPGLLAQCTRALPLSKKACEREREHA